MHLSRWLLDTIGSIAALLSGACYFWFTFTSAWDSDGSSTSVAIWLVLSLLIISAAMAILTLVLRPTRVWLFPLMFSLIPITAAIAALRDPAGPNLLWITIGVSTLLIALGGTYLTRSVISRFARSNYRMERPREP